MVSVRGCGRKWCGLLKCTQCDRVHKQHVKKKRPRPPIFIHSLPYIHATCKSQVGLHPKKVILCIQATTIYTALLKACCVTSVLLTTNSIYVIFFIFFFLQITFTFALQFECSAPLSISLELYRLSQFVLSFGCYKRR